MERLKLSELVLDERFYPRAGVDHVWAHKLAERLQAGAPLPPLIVCRATRALLDGWHRARAYESVYGKDAVVPVEYVECESDAERFRLALAYNAAHGRPYSTVDEAHATVRGEQLGLTRAAIAGILGVRREYLDQIVDRRIAYDRSGAPVVLGRSWDFYAKRTLDCDALQVLKRSEGRRLEELARHLAALVSRAPDDLIERARATLEDLVDILQRRLAE